MLKIISLFQCISNKTCILYKKCPNASSLWFTACAFCAVRVPRGALVAHQSSYAPPLCEPHSTAGVVYPSQYVYGTILESGCSTVLDWRVWRAGSMLLCWNESLSLSLFSNVFSFSSFLLWVGFVKFGSSYLGWERGHPLSPSLALPTV